MKASEVVAAPPTLTLSVVICAYTTRRWDDLVAAVESVLFQHAGEVILVIDYNDDLLALATDRFADRVTVLPNTDTQGLSGARNTGVAAATGDIVGFLDDDATADPDWAATLLAHYLDDTVAAVGGYATPVWPAGHRPVWMPREFDWVVGCSYVGQPTTVAPVRNPIGCNMSLRREVVDGVGGFRSEVGRIGTTPVGGEETELCIRVGAHDATHRILFDPDMAVHHRVSEDRVTMRYFLRRCYHEGLSKAVVAELSSRHTALNTEAVYARQVLPRAVARELRSLRRDGFLRAALIVAGLVVTTAGYLRGTVHRRIFRGAHR